MNTSTAENVAALKNLAHHLQHGVIGKNDMKIPIAGDTTKLPYAHGLTSLERKLAHAQVYLAQHLGGTQAVRRLMGHSQFGARVIYGDCIFLPYLQINFTQV